MLFTDHPARHPRAVLLSLLLSYALGLLLPSIAQAEEEAGPRLQTRSEVLLNLIDSQGASQERTINSRLRLDLEQHQWRQQTRAQVLYTRSDGRTTKEAYNASHQLNYQWAEDYYSLGFARFQRDRFSKISEREIDLLLGQGYRVLRSEQTEWDLEIAAGARYREPVNNPEVSSEYDPLARAASRWQHQLSEDLRLEQDTAYDLSSDTNSWVLEQSLHVRANRYFSLGLAYTWKRSEDRNQNKIEYDRITSVNLVFSWHN
ncbi:DUF481 domain-containing protein [Marinospirillum sp. MEB164]|uniref:DUF481 domain-containing protein n=1 Tax=Marinospirillum alkalitolerans TaxID=3123374 RepID=A0ABW8PW92_9GAMM